MNTFNKLASFDSDEEVLVAQYYHFFKNEEIRKDFMNALGAEIGATGRAKNDMNFIKFSMKYGTHTTPINFKDVQPTVNIKIDSTNKNERFFISLLCSQIELISTLYFFENRHEKGEACALMADNKKTWFDANCPEYNGELKYLDNIFLMLTCVRPDYIAIFKDFYKEHKESSKEFESGFGLILFDKNGNPLQKVNFKFFDLRNAPDQAFRLNPPSSKDNFELSECFNRPIFN
ncbi:hypothetical protein ABTO67_08485 [Acinetobacter baumannii]